jgi:hypothetical protein
VQIGTKANTRIGSPERVRVENHLP